MIEYDYLSRNVIDKTKYRNIRDQRLIFKAQKNPKQLPYKLVLNKTFGASKAKYNDLYDPLQANNICIAGQLLLLDLIEKLEGHWKLIQSNTDGLIGKCESLQGVEKVKQIAHEWEQRTRMTLEFDLYKKIIQKDVNNYIIIDENGGYKSKGAYVKKLSPIDYDLPILNKAVVDFFVKDIDPAETIEKCNDLIMYQKVCKISSKYLYIKHGDKRLNEKCIRVFASRGHAEGVFKAKVTEKSLQLAKIENTPEKCFIQNGNIIGKKVPNHLDKSWYLETAKGRINDFLGFSELPILNDQMSMFDC